MTVQLMAGISAAMFAGAVAAAVFMARRPTYPKALICLALCLGAYALVWVFVRKDMEGNWIFGYSGHKIIGAASAVMVIYLVVVDRLMRKIKEM